jgi:AcrR family transcriptional regulator
MDGTNATPKFTTKGQATRRRILQSAANVLLAEGLSGFSVEKVRQDAAVSGSQIAHYFADRDDLVRAVVEREIEVVLAFHRQPKVGGLDTFEDWEHWARLNARYLRKIGYRGTATYHSLAAQLAKHDPQTRRTFAAGYWRWVTLLEDSLARMKSHGVLIDSADPRELALMVVACHQGAGLLGSTYRQEWPLADVVCFVVNYLRLFAADPAERTSRRPPRPRRRRTSSGPANGRDAAADPRQRFSRKGVATRARIIEGAAEMMFERGVSGTTLDDVRQALGVSGSQISHYFADKEDLVREVITARTDFVVAFHRQPKLGDLDRIQSLRVWADLCWLQAGPGYLRNGCVYGSLTGELLEAEEHLLDALAEGYDRWLQIFEHGLEEMRRRGDLVSEADPRHLAVVLVAGHQGGTMLAHVTGSAEPFRVATDAAIDYVASYAASGSRRTSRSAPRSNKAS